MQEAQRQQEKPITALEASFAEQRSALAALQTELRQQLRIEEGERKSGFAGMQQQMRNLEQEQKPLATLQSSLAEQRSALEVVQAELQKLLSASEDRNSDQMQEKLETYKSMVVKVGQEVRKRLQDLEQHHGKVRELDLDGLQKQLKLQTEQLDLSATLCRNAETAAERLVAAILTGSAFLGCSHILALARPTGLYTVALPVLAAGLGFHFGQRGCSVQHVIDALPQHWQPHLRSCWVKLAATEEIGLNKRARSCLSAVASGAGKLRECDARSCLSAVTNGAGKLRKRFAADSENTAPSNVEPEAPSPKRARLS